MVGYPPRINIIRTNFNELIVLPVPSIPECDFFPIKRDISSILNQIQMKQKYFIPIVRIDFAGHEIHFEVQGLPRRYRESQLLEGDNLRLIPQRHLGGQFREVVDHNHRGLIRNYTVFC